MLTESSITQTYRVIGAGKRIRGGVSASEYEQLFGNNTITKQPNFSESRSHYKSIGWGVTNAKLINLPLLNPKLQSQFDRRSSLERKEVIEIDSSQNLLEDESNNNLNQTSPFKSRKPSVEQRSFLDQINNEYSTTGKCGFLRMNGLFSKHVDKKLHVDSDLYHSMNMVSQKHLVLTKLRKSIANQNYITKRPSIAEKNSPNKSLLEPIHSSTMDNAEKNTMDNTSNNSDLNGTTLMYGR